MCNNIHIKFANPGGWLIKHHWQHQQWENRHTHHPQLCCRADPFSWSKVDNLHLFISLDYGRKIQCIYQWTIIKNEINHMPISTCFHSCAWDIWASSFVVIWKCIINDYSYDSSVTPYFSQFHLLSPMVAHYTFIYLFTCPLSL